MVCIQFTRTWYEKRSFIRLLGCSAVAQELMSTTDLVRADSSAASAMASDAIPSSPVDSDLPSPEMAALNALIVRT